MKRWIPLAVALVALLWAASRLRTPTPSGFDAVEFGRLPVVFNGRVQPFDSVARNSLLQIRNKQTLPDETGKGTLEATPWLMELMFRPEASDARRVFRIDHPELKALLGLPFSPDAASGDDGKHYSWQRLAPVFPKLREQVESAQRKQAGTRTSFEQAVIKLHNAITLYLRLQNTVQPLHSTNFVAELAAYQAAIRPGVAAFQARMRGGEFDTNALMQVLEFSQRYLAMDGMEPPLVLAPERPGLPGDGWQRMGDALLQASVPGPLFRHLVGEKPLPQDEVDRLVASAGTAPLHPGVARFAAMAQAYASGSTVDFNRLVAEYRATLERPFARELGKASRETLFHRAQPFYSALVLYVLAFVVACAHWAGFSETVRRTAWWLVVVAFAVHNVGLLARMTLEGRPPVTNLYSSAIFIGWGAVGLGLLLERPWRNAIGLAVGSLVGFASLVVAHMLSLSGDTMEMMRAVLDTNFWLATHVTVVTLGYAATLVAGFLAIFYVGLGVFTTVLDEKVRRALSTMVYGIVCFATLFSFTGTVLGGIWADQSWGRFWGWDPKENGALMIVLWNALILHARLGGLARERGVVLLAVGGNMVTAWSWFGTNMLNVGLHSYGFTDAAFIGLLLFWGANLAVIGLGLVPTSSWRSFSGRGRTPSAPEPKGRPAVAAGK